VLHLIHGKTLDTDNLPEALRLGPVAKAMEELAVFAQNDIEREKYRARMKAQLDYQTDLVEARMEGKKIGLDEGEKIGLEKGEIKRLIENIRLFQKLLKQTETSTEELGGLSLDDLKTMAERLQQKLIP